jgi:O-antigen biosynthesis protein
MYASAVRALSRVVLRHYKHVLEDPRRLPSLIGAALRRAASGELTARIAAIARSESESDYSAWAERYVPLSSKESEDLELWSGRHIASRLSVIAVMSECLSVEHWTRFLLSCQNQRLIAPTEVVVCGSAELIERLQSRTSLESAVFQWRVVESDDSIISNVDSLLRSLAGDYFCIIEECGELHPYSLALVAKGFYDSPNLVAIYSDEDELSPDGRHDRPRFKPAWSPELLRSLDYLGPLCFFRRSAMLHTAGIPSSSSVRRTLERRLLDRACPVGHLPLVLFHRLDRDSSRRSLDSDVETQSGERVASEIADTRQWRAPAATGWVRPPGGDCPLVTIVIPTRDRPDLLRRCIDTLRRNTAYPRYELLVIDNASVQSATKEFFRELENYSDTRVLAHDAPFNFSALVNIGAAEARGDVLCLLNNDVEVIQSEWLSRMVDFATREGIGAVGALLCYADGVIQHAGVTLGVGGAGAHTLRHQKLEEQAGNELLVARNVSAVTAACLVVEIGAFRAAGGFDESLAVSCNDIDFCLRLQRLGLRNVFTPNARLIHRESASRGYDYSATQRRQQARELATLRTRWQRELEADPYYNPNFSLDFIYKLAFPPRARHLR